MTELFLTNLVVLGSDLKKNTKPFGSVFTALHISNAVLITSTVQL
jgi:hypothetical protein